jgi:hypothetical protein
VFVDAMHGMPHDHTTLPGPSSSVSRRLTKGCLHLRALRLRDGERSIGEGRLFSSTDATRLRVAVRFKDDRRGPGPLDGDSQFSAGAQYQLQHDLTWCDAHTHLNAHTHTGGGYALK